MSTRDRLSRLTADLVVPAATLPATPPAAAEPPAAVPPADPQAVETRYPGDTPRQPGRKTGPGEKLAFRTKSMGTVVELTMWTADKAGAEAASQAVFAELDRVDKLMSHWIATSDVERLNASAGGPPVAIGEETFHILEVAQQVSPTNTLALMTNDLLPMCDMRTPTSAVPG